MIPEATSEWHVTAEQGCIRHLLLLAPGFSYSPRACTLQLQELKGQGFMRVALRRLCSSKWDRTGTAG